MGAVTVELRPDGPHSPDDTRQAAWGMAECIRYLNYATGHHGPEGGLKWPSDVYDVLGWLYTGTSRLSQLHEQIGRWLELQVSANLVRDMSGADPAAKVAELRRCLAAASASAGTLTGALTAAQAAIANLAGPDAEDEP